MRLALLLLLALPLVAQPTITRLAVALDRDGTADIDDGCLRVTFNLTGTSSDNLAFDGGSTTSLGETIADDTASEDGSYWRSMCIGAPSATRYYRITAGATTSDCPVTCTNCGSGDDAMFADGSGIDCTSGQPWRVTHPAEGATTPTAATQPTDINPYDNCASPTTTTTATSGADLKTKWAAQSTAGGVQLIQMAPGVYDIGSGWDYEVPAGGTTHMCLQPLLTDADLRTTPGVQATYAHLPTQIVLERSAAYYGERIPGVPQDLVKGKSNTTLIGVVMRDKRAQPDPQQATVTAVTPGTPGSTSTTLTLSGACPDGFQNAAQVMLSLPGMTYPAIAYIDSCASSVLSVNRFQSTLPAFSGTLSANGTATLGLPRITGCTQTTPIQCDTATPHGLPVSSYLEYDTVVVRGVNGQTGANGRSRFTVIDADTLELDDTTSVGAFTSSPYAFIRLGGATRFSYLNVNGTTNFSCAQCVIGNPDDGSFGVTNMIAAGQTTNFVWVDGLVLGATAGCVISLTDSLPDCPYHLTQNVTGIRLDEAVQVYVANSRFVNLAGIVLNAQNQSTVPRDWTITGNQFVASDRVFFDVAGNGYFPGATNDYYSPGLRHLLEAKGGISRLTFTSNLVDGVGVEGSATQGYTLACYDTVTVKGGAAVARCEDVDIRGNYFRNIPTLLVTGSQTLPTPPARTNRSFNRRVRIAENVIVSNALERRVSPQLNNNAGTAADNSGTPFALRGGGSDHSITRNTVYSTQGLYAGTLILAQTYRMPGCVVENNVLPWHDSITTDGFLVFSPGLSPVDASTFQTTFDDLCPGGSFANNLVQPGVENSSNVSGLKDSSNDADTLTSAEWSAAWATSGSFSGVVSGPSGASYAIRHAALFVGSTAEVESAYSSYGVADFAALRRAVFGEVRGFNRSIFDSNLTLTWTSPVTTGCTVRASSDSWTTALSQTDVGGDTDQTVLFSSLASGAYDLLVECPGAKTFSSRVIVP